MFKRVLIANRGEIAVRITRTLQQMGIESVAVYSEVDRNGMHVRVADRAYPLGGTSGTESYLDGKKIIALAREYQVDAIHPGVGFLSENGAFAQDCADAGIVFIGPSPEVIRIMGDKVAAKRAVAQVGVPVIPGAISENLVAKSELERSAKAIGYPVLMKAVAGGGGKGVRLIQNERELHSAYESVEREAMNAFGDARIFLEKYVSKSRHVEFQIFADHHGNAVHLFERECSIQRRFQKIVEESPSPVLSFQLRKQMGEAALQAAKAVGYTNAGTVEFMVDASGNYYFLEMNTRLQVEHPVTEMTVRQDLVRAQVLVAAGEKLPFYQATIKPEGHAMECRIYAEDPRRGFLPSTGIIEVFVPPEGPNIRVDHAITPGTAITIDYDPMIAKLIVWGRSRGEVLQRMSWALKNFAILGVTTNVDFLQDLMIHPKFVSGEIHTQFLDEYPLDKYPMKNPGTEVLPDVVLLAAAITGKSKRHERRMSDKISSPWESIRGWSPV